MAEWFMSDMMIAAYKGAASGMGAAVLLDVLTFFRYKDWRESVSHFSWSVASFAWIKGAVMGFLVGLGIDVTL